MVVLVATPVVDMVVDTVVAQPHPLQVALHTMLVAGKLVLPTWLHY
jgi:hypothetical protein